MQNLEASQRSLELQKEHSKAEMSLLGYEMGRMRSGITLSCNGRVSWTSRS